MDYVIDKNLRIIYILLIFLLAGTMSFVALARVPIYGVASDVAVVITQPTSQSYAEHITGNMALIIHNAVHDESILEQVSRVTVKRIPDSGAIRITTYDDSALRAAAIHKMIYRNIGTDVRHFYPTQGVTLRTIGQPYKTIRVPLVMGIILIAVLMSAMFVTLVMPFIQSIVYRRHTQREGGYARPHGESASVVATRKKPFVQEQRKKWLRDLMRHQATSEHMVPSTVKEESVPDSVQKPVDALPDFDDFTSSPTEDVQKKTMDAHTEHFFGEENSFERDAQESIDTKKPPRGIVQASMLPEITATEEKCIEEVSLPVMEQPKPHVTSPSTPTPTPQPQRAGRAASGAPGNLPTVDASMFPENAGDDTLHLDSVGKSIEEVEHYAEGENVTQAEQDTAMEGEPTEEELKNRLNQLLKGTL